MRRNLPPLGLAAVALAAALCAVLVAACGADEAKPTATVAAECRPVEQPEPKAGLTLPKPTERLDPTAEWEAVVMTNCGTFTIALDTDASPKTAASFAYLARRGFYDELTFHRIAPGFVIQGGDPLGDGLGGPGYAIAEPPPRTVEYVRGVVAMAKTAADPDGTSGSQFFVVTADDAQLPAQYALLGSITDGYDVIERIEGRPLTDTDPQGSPPVDPIVIDRIAIRER